MSYVTTRESRGIGAIARGDAPRRRRPPRSHLLRINDGTATIIRERPTPTRVPIDRNRAVVLGPNRMPSTVAGGITPGLTPAPVTVVVVPPGAGDLRRTAAVVAAETEEPLPTEAEIEEAVEAQPKAPPGQVKKGYGGVVLLGVLAIGGLYLLSRSTP